MKTERDDLIQHLLKAVSSSQGASARLLVKEINSRKKFHKIVTKKDINPILYRERQLFRSEGWSPPRWFTTSNAASPSPQASRPKPSPATAKRENKPTNRASVYARKPNPEPKKPEPTRSNITVKDLQNRLYAWQKDAVETWNKANGRGVIQAVTGSGKTMVALHMISRYVAANRICLIIVPSIALLKQWKEAIEIELGIRKLCILGGGYGNVVSQNTQVFMGTVHTLSKISNSLPTPHLLIADEVHRYGAPTFQKALLPQAPHRLGLTATFERADEAVDEVLKPYFSAIIYEYNYGDAKRDNVIANFSVALLGTKLSGQESEKYDDISNEMTTTRNWLAKNLITSANGNNFFSVISDAARSFDRIGRQANKYLKLISDRKKLIDTSTEKFNAIPLLAKAIQTAKKTIIFCSATEVADNLVVILRNVDIEARAYHSKQKENERQEVLEALQDGDIDVIVAVNALDEGIDVPDLDLGIIISGSKQRRQMIQRMGRIVRKKHDGRGAAFILLYAEGTNEDPQLTSLSNGENEYAGHIDVLIENADETHKYKLSEIRDGDSSIEDFVRRSIRQGFDFNVTRMP